MPDQVQEAVKASRSRAMRQLGNRQVRAFHRRFVGRTLSVLWETANSDGQWRGLTDNYLTVTTASEAGLANLITPTHLTAVAGQGLCGDVILA